MSTKLFVGNLSFNTTENDLQDAFAAHGTVVETNLMMDRETGRPRGFGFVTMSTPDEAQKAIDALNGKELSGRALTVNLARPREIDREGATGQFLAIQRINRFLRFVRCAHGNEAKPTGTSRFAVHH